MNEVPPARPARKLPVEIVVKRAVLFSWESRYVLVRPSLIYAVLTFLADLVVIHFTGSKDRTPIELVAVIMPLIGLAFAVGINRFVLLGEAPPGIQFFRFDRYYIRYVLLSIMLAILAVIAAAPLLAAAGDPDAAQAGMNGAAALVGVITLSLAAIVLTRLSLLLASAAAGDETRAKTVWEMTQGNSFRLVLAGLIVFLPFWVLEAVLAGLLPDKGDSAVGVLVALADGMLSPVRLIVMTVTLALCYDLLVRGNGPAVTDRRNG